MINFREDDPCEKYNDIALRQTAVMDENVDLETVREEEQSNRESSE